MAARRKTARKPRVLNESLGSIYSGSILLGTIAARAGVVHHVKNADGDKLGVFADLAEAKAVLRERGGGKMSGLADGGVVKGTIRSCAGLVYTTKDANEKTLGKFGTDQAARAAIYAARKARAAS